jgi:hypothetical protein
LVVGSAIAQLTQEAQQTLYKATHLSAASQERLESDLSTAIQAHQQIRVQNAFERLTGLRRPSFHSLASDLGVNDPVLRQALHEQGMRTIGMPKTTEPIDPNRAPRRFSLCSMRPI